MTQTNYYQLAYQYIQEKMLKEAGVEQDILPAYLVPIHPIGYFKEVSDLYEHLLLHAQNRGQGGGRMRKIFGSKGKPSNEKRWAALRELLYEFQPAEIADKYDTYDLLYALRQPPFLLEEASIPDYSFCLTIIHGARYFRQFPSASKFYEHFKLLAQSPKPELTVQNELGNITGIGPALALDYLKELGFDQFVKPDLHIMDICFGLAPKKYMKHNRDTAGAIRQMKDMANVAGKTPYSLDKLFWLIGSGGFYELPGVDDAEREKALKRWSNKKSAGARKESFIDFVLNNME